VDAQIKERILRTKREGEGNHSFGGRSLRTRPFSVHRDGEETKKEREKPFSEETEELWKKELLHRVTGRGGIRATEGRSHLISTISASCVLEKGLGKGKAFGANYIEKNGHKPNHTDEKEKPSARLLSQNEAVYGDDFERDQGCQ